MSDITPVRRAKKMGLREVIRSVGWLPLISPLKRHQRSLEKALPLDIVQRRRLLDGVGKWQAIIVILLCMLGITFPFPIASQFEGIWESNNFYLKLYALLIPIMVFLGSISWPLGIISIRCDREYKYASLISHSCISTGNATLDSIFRRDKLVLEEILVKDGFSEDDIRTLNAIGASMENMEKERCNMPEDSFQICLNSKCEALVMRAARACGLDKEDSGALQSLSAPLDVLSCLGISPDLTARGENKLLVDSVP